MNTTTTKTHWANIYVGMREGYSDDVSTIEIMKKAVSKFVNQYPCCVTVTETEYIYVDGTEKGVIIGLINYPRFPKTQEIIKEYALDLATHLRAEFRQNRVTVMCADETIMIGDNQ